MRNGTHTPVVSRVLAKVARTPLRRVSAFAFEPGVPPKEIQLWNLGDNATDYGVHKWTARSASLVMGRYQERGNPLVIDVEHNGVNVAPDAEVSGELEPPVTGGYASLELRAGAPWLIFDWSKYAVEQISTKQRRCLSPEYDVDQTTGEIVGLYRVSLVADPGTHHARMLASAASSGQERTGMDPIVVAALKAALTAEDPKAAIEALLAEISKASGDAPAEGEDAAAAPPPGDGPPAAPGDKKDAPVAAAADKSSDAPVTAAADEKMQCAAKPTDASAAKPVPIATPAPVMKITAAAPTEVVDVGARADLEAMRRDVLLEKEGHRITEPSVRVWASSQPYAVVKGLIDSTPAKLDPPSRIAATRGATGHEPREAGSLLPPEQKAKFQAMTKTTPRTKLGPHIEADGSLRIYACTPTEYRDYKTAQAAKGGAK